MGPVEEVADALVVLVRRLKGVHAAACAEVGVRLEVPSMAALARLAEHGRQRPSALAEVLGVDLSTVSRQVAALEREGWVQRERDPDDQRAQLLDLTPAGQDVVRRIRAARVRLLDEMTAGWDGPDLSAFAAQLRRFADDLPGARPALLPTAGEAAR